MNLFALASIQSSAEALRVPPSEEKSAPQEVHGFLSLSDCLTDSNLDEPGQTLSIYY